MLTEIVFFFISPKNQFIDNHLYRITTIFLKLSCKGRFQRAAGDDQRHRRGPGRRRLGRLGVAVVGVVVVVVDDDVAVGVARRQVGDDVFVVGHVLLRWQQLGRLGLQVQRLPHARSGTVFFLSYSLSYLLTYYLTPLAAYYLHAPLGSLFLHTYLLRYYSLLTYSLAYLVIYLLSYLVTY